VSRDIKFRAWDSVAKKFYLWGFGVSPETGAHWTGPPTQVDRFTHGQFTGLQDKNGKDIYEGDIIEYKGETHPYYTPKYFRGVVSIGEILVTTGGAGHGEGPPKCRAFAVIITDKYKASLLEISENDSVVGNVHENPELLKGKDGE
jgi:uncharacterized phage protein (TIGR01671 family)